MGVLQTAKALSDAIKGKGPTPPPQVPAPPVYRFRALNGDGSSPALGDFDGRKPYVTFRLPPNSISFDQPVRGEVIQDLDGNSTIIDGGLGVAKVSMRGTYGVGPGAADFKNPSAGFANMREVRDFFVTWAEVNRTRALAGRAPLRLQFRIIGGQWTEWAYRALWVFPITLPTEERSASSPLAWNYSFNFWAWEVERDKYRPKDPVSFPDFASKLPKWIEWLLNMLKWYKRLQTIVRLMKRLARELQAWRDGLVNSVRGVFQTIRGLVGAVKDTLRALNPVTLVKEIKNEIRIGLIGLKKDLGAPMRWSTTEGYAASRTPGVRPVSVPVNPGQTIQKATQRAGVDWVPVAERNGLRYPFVAVTQ